MKKRAKDAEALAKVIHEEVYGSKILDPTTLQVEPGSPAEPIVEPVVEPIVESTVPVVEPVEELAIEPTPEPEPVKPAISSPAPEPDDWKHKYNVLQGMYNKLNDDHKDTARDVEILNNALAAMRSEPTVDVPAPAFEPAPVSEAASILQREYPGMFEGIQSLIKGELESFARKEITQVVSRLERTETTTLKDKKDKFYEALAGLVPDWVIVNNDPKFIEALQDREQYSGLTKHDLLTDAYNRLDAPRAARFFLDYKKVTAPAPKPDLTPALHPDTSSGAAAAPVTSGVPREIITGSYITKFYTDLANGKYRGKPKDAEIIRAKIDKAVQERRVDQSK